MGLHLALKGWILTERTWHADGYLNPEFVGEEYAAVSMALDDISPEAGLEFIHGSHRWALPHLTRADVWKQLGEDERLRDNRPSTAKRFVTEHWEREIAAQRRRRLGISSRRAGEAS